MAYESDDFIRTIHIPARIDKPYWSFRAWGNKRLLHFNRSIGTATDDRLTVELNTRNT